MSIRAHLSKLSNFFGLEDEGPNQLGGYEQPENLSAKPTFSASDDRRMKQNIEKNSTKTERSMFRKVQDDKVRVQKQVPNTPTPQSVNRSPELDYTSPRAKEIERRARETKVVPIQSQGIRPEGKSRQKTITKNSNKIIVVEPRVYSEAMDIAKHILNGESVLVNFHLVEEYQARRIVDFLTGTVFAEDGDIKRVAGEVFLCTPKTMEIDGTLQTSRDTNLFEVN